MDHLQSIWNAVEGFVGSVSVLCASFLCKGQHGGMVDLGLKLWSLTGDGRRCFSHSALSGVMVVGSELGSMPGSGQSSWFRGLGGIAIFGVPLSHFLAPGLHSSERFAGVSTVGSQSGLVVADPEDISVACSGLLY